MTACERVGSTEGASNVFKLMREQGLEANEIIYGAAISCCRKAREPERALLLLKKMIKEGLQPNIAVFNTVLVAQSESRPFTEKDFERCIVVHKILKTKEYTTTKPNRQTYGILIRTLASNGHPQFAEQLLKEMQADEASGGGGMVPDVDLYTATVTGYERLGRPLQAVRLMEKMRSDGYDFYESSVLNSAFKKAVRLANAVGRGLAATGAGEDEEIGTGGVEDGNDVTAAIDIDVDFL